MINLNIKSLLALTVYLFFTGIVAVNVHIQMTNLGVSYPSWEPPIWVNVTIFVIQSLGALWMAKSVLKWMNTPSFIKHWVVVFITMGALQQLFIRLPLTAGYVMDQKFLFQWIYTYFPQLLMTSILTVGMVFISRTSKIQRWCLDYLIVGGISALAFLYLQSALQDVSHSLLVFVEEPNSSAILIPPYPWQVDAIGSITFVEPVIAALFICYLISKECCSSFADLSLKTILALMVLTQSGAKFFFYLYFSTIENTMDRILSVSQFTLEFVVIGLAVSAAISYLTNIYHIKPFNKNR